MKRTCRESVLSFLAFWGRGRPLYMVLYSSILGRLSCGERGGILFSLFLIAGSIWYVPLRNRMERSKARSCFPPFSAESVGQAWQSVPRGQFS